MVMQIERERLHKEMTDLRNQNTMLLREMSALQERISKIVQIIGSFQADKIKTNRKFAEPYNQNVKAMFILENEKVKLEGEQAK
jgi:uncharacterized protein YllA (UPF0747 family)